MLMQGSGVDCPGLIPFAALIGCARRMKFCFDCRNIIVSKEGLRKFCMY